MTAALALDPQQERFYARSVLEVARDLIGVTLRHGDTAGRIVEVEAYHECEPACHAYAGPTPRTEPLFGPPGRLYVYRSYGIHSLVNFVTNAEGIGAAVLIRALEPVAGLETMRRRRGAESDRELCSGPGKLTVALGIGLELNGAWVEGGPLQLDPSPGAHDKPSLVADGRIGITKATDLPWRFCVSESRWLSRSAATR
ncbi:MAG: DNA-3-methyladenine glycosylase [Thermoleophilaceae bacterium]|nr:DNA-3-methyladenine glycosylase [Thermoleophilaceae bacterium]